MVKFVGRTKELLLLNALWHKDKASLVVVKGRRRIGKSRLIAEFGKNYRYYSFAGSPPNSSTDAQSERDDFTKQLYRQFSPPEKFDTTNWWDLLWFLADTTAQGKVVILFDEISWMASKDPNFLGKLKTVWDENFSKNPNLCLVLCGSISLWIQENILSSSGFMGRISLILDIKELPLSDCNQFWYNQSNNVSAYEKFKLLAVTGGVPRYLEEIDPNISSEENIKKLCFEHSGILYHEFDQIFSDLFYKRYNIYKQIVESLAGTPLERQEITKILKLQSGGMTSEYLEDLKQAGFIARDYSWNIKDGKFSKLSKYRICDNYLRFYLRYILPNKMQIELASFDTKSISSLPGWTSIMGLQFENLVLNNRQSVKEALGLAAEDIIADNPFFQHKTNRNKGCQIDYMIQTRDNNLYICEIKFSKHEVRSEVVAETAAKIKSMQIPKFFSVRPILIHVNGVSEELEDKRYFSRIIDFSSLLEK